MTQPDFEDNVRDIAQATNTPQEAVSKLYADTLAEVREHARVQDFVPLFVAKRVKAQLLNNQRLKH